MRYSKQKSIPKKVELSLLIIIGRIWHKEREDFKNKNGPKHHNFRHLVNINNWLYRTKDKPERALKDYKVNEQSDRMVAGS
jgi:hypothetical protein